MALNKARRDAGREFLQPDHPHYVDVRYTPAVTAGAPAPRPVQAPGILTSVPVETDDRVGRRTVLRMALDDATPLRQGQRITTTSPHTNDTSIWGVNYVQRDGMYLSEVLLGP